MQRQLLALCKGIEHARKVVVNLDLADGQAIELVGGAQRQVERLPQP